MSTRFVFPKIRLAKLLKEPGGVPVVEAIEQAAENLRVLAPECGAEVIAVLEQVEASFATFPMERDEFALAELYAITGRSIGTASVAGLEGFDAALLSLCNLLDHLRTHGRWDRDAIAVHVRALRLLSTISGPAGASAEPILSGLAQVTRRYAPPEPEAT